MKNRFTIACLLAVLNLAATRAGAQCAVTVPNYTSGGNVNVAYNISWVQTFKPACSGQLSTVVFPNINVNVDDLRNTGYKVEFRLRNAAGTVLATAPRTDQWYPGATVTFDFSCKNIMLTGGTTYQWELLAISSSGQATDQLVFLVTSTSASIYADGNSILDGTSYPNMDFYGWTVNLMTSPPAATASATATQDPAVCNLFSNGSSQAIAAVTAIGAALGSTTAKLTLQGTAPAYNGQRYVRRYYDITPTSNRNTATASVTLYFAQADFDDYNAVRGNLPSLPVNSADAANYRNNIRITQQHGTSATGAPGSFTGWAGNGPANLSIVPSLVAWNSAASRWEVTFSVTGFSGFFLHTGAAVLPLQWLSISGSLTAQNKAALQWQVEEAAVKTYSVERSTDGTSFTTVATVNSKGDGHNQYSFTDDACVTGTAYYRIAQTDVAGRLSYSGIVRLNTNKAGSISLYPNPAKEKLLVSLPAGLLQTEASLLTLDGRLLRHIKLKAHVFTLDLGNDPPGVYLLRFANGVTERLVKE